MTALPYNSLAWALGAVAMLVFGYKSRRSFQTAANPVSGYYAWFGFLVGTAMVLFSVPELLGLPDTVLIATYYASYFILFGGLIVQSKLDWYVLLRHRIRFAWIGWPVGLISAAAWLGMLGHSRIDRHPHVAGFFDPTFSVTLEAVLYLVVLLPMAWAFFLQTSKGGWLGRFKALVIGLTYVGISLSAAYDAVSLHNSDSLSDTWVNAAFFGIFLLANLLSSPAKKPETPPAIQPAA